MVSGTGACRGTRQAVSPSRRSTSQAIGRIAASIPSVCGLPRNRKATNPANGARASKWQERGAQVRKGEKATLVVFWKFADEAKETEEDRENTASGSRLLFSRGYAVFN